MKANELRIGNFVINDCNDQIFQVTAADILTASQDPKWLLPIPLSHEWMEKCGFRICEDFGDEQFYRLDRDSGYSYEIQNFRGQWALYSFRTVNKAPNLIKDELHLQYVHQLQNLYYALTSTELSISEQLTR